MVSALGQGPITPRLFTLAEVAVGEKLPPPTRAAVLMALLGIALLGMLLVVIILLGGHWVRRQGRVRRGPAVPPDRRPLTPASSAAVEGGDPLPLPQSMVDQAPGETIISDDTQPGRRQSP